MWQRILWRQTQNSEEAIHMLRFLWELGLNSLTSQGPVWDIFNTEWTKCWCNKNCLKIQGQCLVSAPACSCAAITSGCKHGAAFSWPRYFFIILQKWLKRVPELFSGMSKACRNLWLNFPSAAKMSFEPTGFVHTCTSWLCFLLAFVAQLSKVAGMALSLGG